MNIENQEKQQVTDLPLEVSNLMISPDGKHLAFTLEVFHGMTIEETRAKLDEDANRKSSGILYERLLIRHWDHWKDGRRSKLFVLPTSGGTPLNVMKDMDADTPSQPFGDTQEITFTPDSKGLVFTAKDVGQQEAWSTDFDLFYVPIDASQLPKKLTENNRAWDSHPVFSPDGKTLAYLAMKQPQHERDRFRIVLRNWESSTEEVLTEDWDRTVKEYFWSNDGKKIYALAENFAQGALFSIEVPNGKVTTLLSDGHVRSPALAGKKFLFGLDNLKSPVELYTANLTGKKLKQITRLNDERLDQIKMGDYEQFNFPGWNNETVYGYLVKPVDFDPNKKYPVAFLIHGGPHGSFGNDFHYRWNPQTYCGAGYAVVMIDFHASVGYGQAFQDAMRMDWGGKPLEDLQKGLAAAIEKYPFLDGERVGALGASYGGYMINWIAGNWPDRFRCLVNHDGNLDERMAYFDTEELWFPEWEHGGTPWDNPEGYEKQNPVNFIKNWKTPMLVIHGELDYRVVVTQGISTFNALQRMGIPSQFLYFPDENHWVLKPHNSIQWHETVIAWLDRWLK
jgi:dipeptidyl aminopeptidase/acylaminoacyl peptidase